MNGSYHELSNGHNSGFQFFEMARFFSQIIQHFCWFASFDTCPEKNLRHDSDRVRELQNETFRKTETVDETN